MNASCVLTKTDAEYCGNEIVGVRETAARKGHTWKFTFCQGRFDEA
jgi:hypothetical protein